MIKNLILGLVFPKRCVSCGALGSYLCRECFLKINFIKEHLCPVCERPAIGGATHPGCRRRYCLDGLISVCSYEGPVRMAIKRLKYKPWITDLGGMLTTLILRYLQGDALVDHLIEVKPVIVPVPLHKTRESERGFNQSKILGKLLAQKLDLNFIPDLLIRQKKTKPQAELKGKERQENIKDAFAINPRFQSATGKLANLQIILVDDVWTTGATLRSCGNVLKRAGVKTVWALTLAR